MLAGRYRLVRRIATGGMGAVHEAVDERLGRRVAVKVLHEQFVDDPAFVDRFRREARAAAALSNPHIAQVFDSGEHEGRQYIVMELVDGEDLGQLLGREHRLAPERAADVAAQVCSALAAAHAAGIVHRDIKPGNVLVRSDGQVKVTDFGIAKTAGQARLTGTGTVLGTAFYVSPEQASGQGATTASDVYAVGVVLFEMLTGSPPFTGESPVAVAVRHIRDEVPPVHLEAPDVSPALGQLVAIATAKDPHQRFVDAAHMQAALHDALLAAPASTSTAAMPDQSTTARQPRAGARATATARTWRPGIVALALVLTALLGMIWLTVSTDRPSPPADASPPQAEPTQPSHQPSTKERIQSGQPRPKQQEPRGPVMPVSAVGGQVATVEDRLKNRGYDVHKVDVDSSAPKDSIVATIPRPGRPLSSGQTVVLVASKGEPADQPSRYVIPARIIGSDAKVAEQRLSEHDLDVKKVDVTSSRREDVVLATYPAPGATARAGTVVLAVSTGR